MAKKNKKLNYNPFKMAGSWIGLAVLGFFSLLFRCLDSCRDSYWVFKFGLSGFLIGWAIHSFIRKFMFAPTSER